MKGIAVYIEGGGETSTQKATLRTGFDALFKVQKSAAQAKNLSLRLVSSGSRNNAYQNFMNAVEHSGDEVVCALLVDSEESVADEVGLTSRRSGEVRKLVQEEVQRRNADVRRRHLENRDHWDLSRVDPQRLHLMVQCMETWIVADPEALADYYQNGFLPKKLPKRLNLEHEPKTEVYEKLAMATKNTSKGEYSEASNAKIKHASKLLACIAPTKLAVRCPRFATFVSWLDHQIENA